MLHCRAAAIDESPIALLPRQPLQAWLKATGRTSHRHSPQVRASLSRTFLLPETRRRRPTRYERENPGVPVVRNVEDLWMVAKVQQLKKARMWAAATDGTVVRGRSFRSLLL